MTEGNEPATSEPQTKAERAYQLRMLGGTWPQIAEAVGVR
jgi:hypothetical protein